MDLYLKMYLIWLGVIIFACIFSGIANCFAKGSSAYKVFRFIAEQLFCAVILMFVTLITLIPFKIIF